MGFYQVLIDLIKRFFSSANAASFQFITALAVIVLSVLVYYLVPKKLKNLSILLSSIVFIGIYQVYYLGFFFFYVLINYFLGRSIHQDRDDKSKKKTALVISVLINIALLVLFKTLSQYATDVFNPFMTQLPSGMGIINDWIFPIGFSYLCFQAISYHIDVANKHVEAENNVINFAAYLLMFPKILAGPIERYRNIAADLHARDSGFHNFREGLKRFIPGLAKKVLIADTIAKFINPVFALETPSIPTDRAWLILIAFTIQLYFDFSGFADMAVGLGKMFGFNLMENFNYPYISKSITEFWRRWHISLSSWFRDYVFYPLEFSRKKHKFITQRFNILLVFTLTGLWHGFTLNFMIWGFIMGLVIVIESSKFKKVLKKTWAPLQHVWTLGWIVFSWIFFRSPTLGYAWNFIRALTGTQAEVLNIPVSVTWPYPIIDNSTWLALIFGILFSTPIFVFAKTRLNRWLETHPRMSAVAQFTYMVLLLLLFIASVASISSNGFIPGVYEKF